MSANKLLSVRPCHSPIVLRRAVGQVGKHLLALHHRQNALLPCVRLTESSRIKIVEKIGEEKINERILFPVSPCRHN